MDPLLGIKDIFVVTTALSTCCFSSILFFATIVMWQIYLHYPPVIHGGGGVYYGGEKSCVLRGWRHYRCRNNLAGWEALCTKWMRGAWRGCYGVGGLLRRRKGLRGCYGEGGHCGGEGIVCCTEYNTNPMESIAVEDNGRDLCNALWP